jgi:hypothetical protein
MRHGKNGLAFVKVLLARKIYFREVGLLPFFRGGVNLTGGHSGWPVHGEVADPAAARSPARLLDVIGEGERRTYLWRGGEACGLQ